MSDLCGSQRYVSNKAVHRDPPPVKLLQSDGMLWEAHWTSFNPSSAGSSRRPLAIKDTDSVISSDVANPQKEAARAQSERARATARARRKRRPTLQAQKESRPSDEGREAA